MSQSQLNIVARPAEADLVSRATAGDETAVRAIIRTHNPVSYTHLDVYKRQMLESALPLFESGGAFVAIGAMHQTGPDGLVALLRQRGFTVTAIE